MFKSFNYEKSKNATRYITTYNKNILVPKYFSQFNELVFYTKTKNIQLYLLLNHIIPTYFKEIVL